MHLCLLDVMTFDLVSEAYHGNLWGISFIFNQSINLWPKHIMLFRDYDLWPAFHLHFNLLWIPFILHPGYYTWPLFAYIKFVWWHIFRFLLDCSDIYGLNFTTDQETRSQPWLSPGGGPRVVVSTAAFHARVRGSVPGLGGLKETKMFLPHPRVKVSIVGSLRDREVVCSASDRQGSNFESCVWRTVSSQSSHHPQEVLLAQFSLYVHKGGLKPDSFHFPWLTVALAHVVYSPTVGQFVRLRVPTRSPFSDSCAPEYF